MLKPASLVVISITIFAFQLLNTCTAVVVLKKQSSFSKGQLMLGPCSFKDGNLVYALCDNHEHDIQCKVVQEKQPYKDTARTCNISLIAEQKNGEIQSSIGIAALGKDKVILFWHETGAEEYLKIDTIKMDSCKVYESKLSRVSLSTFVELRHMNDILTYDDDTYDVIFQDADRCGNKMCKMSIDAEGKIIAEPAGYMTSNKQFISFASPIATRSPSKGFVYTRIDADETSLWIIKPDGKEKLLTKYKKTGISAVSAVNNIITSCVKLEGTPMTCTQFDEDGKTKFTTNLTSIDEKTQILRVHSSAKGGFLMMTAKCETGSCDKAASSQIIRVDADGKQAGSFRLIDFESAIVERHWAHIYQNAGDENYCAAFVGEKRTQGQMEHLNVVVNCFNNADFQK